MDFDLNDLLPNMDETIKSTVWRETRSDLNDFLMKTFYRKMSFAMDLNDMASKSNNLWSANSIPLRTLGNTAAKLDKLRTIGDPFKFYFRLQDFLIGSPSEVFLNREICEDLFAIMHKWLGKFYICKYNRCHELCLCSQEMFNKAVRNIEGFSYEKLLCQERPSKSLQTQLFGVLLQRIINILSEIDVQLPSYQKFYETNAGETLNFLSFYGIGFQVTHRNRTIFLNIDRQSDRFEINTLRRSIFPQNTILKDNDFVELNWINCIWNNFTVSRVNAFWVEDLDSLGWAP